MIYAVIDTNVLVAAAKSHKPTSSASSIVSLVFNDTIQPLICDEILKEYEEILNHPALSIPSHISTPIIEKFKVDGIDPGRTELKWDLPDPTDKIFYEVSGAVEGSYVITNNVRHYPDTPEVVTPSEMLLILKQLGIVGDYQ